MEDRQTVKKIPKIETIKVKPEVHAELCPVCNGFGTLKYGTKTCQGCKGKGYILVPNKMEGNNNAQTE